MDKIYQRIYAVIKRIPKGRVSTYSQIAKLAGIPGAPRRVGYALSILPEDEKVPWHRVVNAKGEVSPRIEMGYAELQQDLLRKEGVRFDKQAKIVLKKYQWKPAVSRHTFHPAK